MVNIKLTVHFESGARLGPGKAQLLSGIRETGSISAAARAMGMSYKRAWVLLDSTNQTFTEPVVVAVSGGPGGGGARLTPFGEEVLERYQRMLERATASVSADVDALARRASPNAGPKV